MNESRVRPVRPQPSIAATLTACLLANACAALLLQIMGCSIALATQGFDPRILQPFTMAFIYLLFLLIGLLPSALFLLMPRRWLGAADAIGVGTVFGYWAATLVALYQISSTTQEQLSTRMMLVGTLALLFTAIPAAAGWWVGHRFLAKRRPRRAEAA